MSQGVNPRRAALNALLRVLQKGQSLSQVLPDTLAQIDDKRDRGFAQHLIYGTLRHYHTLAAIRDLLVTKPLKAKDQDIDLLMLMALLQILYLDTPDHAAVSETVSLSQKLKKPWAKGLLNGVLRRFLREKSSLLKQIPQRPDVQYSHPKWLVNQLQNAYPMQLESILEQNNQAPGLSLRVNTRMQSREQLLEKLQAAGIEAQAHPLSPVGIEIQQAVDIPSLPSYNQGGFSVQDIAAQQAALLLDPKPGMRLLDACAAPGGKTTHLLEHCNNQAWLLALEKDADRIGRLEDNLKRLNLTADVKVADAADHQAWWDGEYFDQILLDAPCSATGIIRRHPDIKFHRREEDIAALNQLQAQILDSVWQTLKPGGLLLYATCSVLPSENRKQIEAFLERTENAELRPMLVNWGHGDIGRQILPGESGMDGFYYALIGKKEDLA